MSKAKSSKKGFFINKSKQSVGPGVRKGGILGGGGSGKSAAQPAAKAKEKEAEAGPSGANRKGGMEPETPEQDNGVDNGGEEEHGNRGGQRSGEPGGGGGGGGGLGRTLEPMINQTHFHDKGWTTVSTRTLWIPPCNLEAYHNYNTELQGGGKASYTQTDWTLIDWNTFDLLHGPRELDHILNNYEAWRPKQWALEISGIKVITTQTIQGTGNSTVDLTGALCIATRNKGTIPYMLNGFYEDSQGRALVHPWGAEPWKPTAMYKYRYFSNVYGATGTVTKSFYMVEKGMVEHYTGPDVYTIGDTFGQSSWIDNWHTTQHVLDPMMVVGVDNTSWGQVVNSNDHYTLFDPQPQNPGDYHYQTHSEDWRVQDRNTTAQYKDNNTRNTKYTADANLDTWTYGLGTGTNKEMSTNRAAAISNAQRWVKSWTRAPIFCIKPYGATVHHARISTSIVNKAPPMTLVRLKPQFTTGTTTILNQSASCQVKVVCEWEARPYAEPLGKMEPRKYYVPTPPTAQDGLWIPLNDDSGIAFGTYPAPEYDDKMAYPWGATKILY